MEKLKDIDRKVRKELAWVNANMDKINPHLELCSSGSISDINNIPESYYYRYLAAMMRALKPNQVVELGSAGGASALMMLSTLPLTSKMYCCSVPEPEGEFRFINEDKYPNLQLLRGDDLSLGIWHGVNLKNTDIWFIDTEHSYEQLHAELAIYDRFFKKGAIVLLDDIRMNEGMIKAWNEIKYEKLSLPDLHHSGFGMFLC